MSKKYLVIGSGGREHAIAWALSRDSESYVLPGNPGMVQDAQTVSGNPNDFEFVAKKAKELEIDTVVIGPEDPLCAGIADVLEKHGLKVFGPKKTASKLEGSKVFAKEFMKKHGIPTANSEVFSNEKDALEFIKKLIFPVVIKVDGLAAGKGVQIVYNMFDAESVLHGIFSDCKFGASGEQIVIEEFLVGKELSILGVTDGNVIKPLPHSRDHKQLLDGNRGPMTGGMGAFCPVPGISSELFETIRTTILEKTLEGLKKDGIPYKGVIFFGLMLTDDGPKVLEYNCRFGDPETQVVLMQIETPLSEIVDAVVDEKLSDLEIKVKKGFLQQLFWHRKVIPINQKRV
ncbi:MAG: phosphoribosylamine--glycine ligase [Caldisericia bacterium]